MPVTPQYSWHETEAALQVKVELKGVSRKQLDVFATSALIKVNAPPYLLSVDLAYDVDDNRSTASVDRSCVKFNLVKKSPGLWGKLAVEGDKDAISRRREKSIDDAHAAANAARKAVVEKKKKDEKLIQERQYELENSKRRTIEQRKKEEFDAEADGLTRWQRSLHDPAANDSDTESEDEEVDAVEAGGPEKPMADHPDYHGRGWRSEGEPKVEHRTSIDCAERELAAQPVERREAVTDSDGDIWGENEDEEHSRYSTDTESDSSGDEEEVGTRSARVVKLLPPPRRTMQPVEVAFTRLETDVLPARENRELELKEYKKQQKEKAGLLDTMDVAERQPVFLKEKGDALYAQGNFQGAINAYSTALQMDPNHLLSLTNRAACWLKLKAADRCVADCDEALELLRPRLKRWEAGDTSEEELTRFKRTFTRVLARKGAAHVQLEELPEALAAYKEAAKYSSEDAALQRNLEEVRASMGQVDAAALRERADARFKAGDHIGAAEAYGLLLSLTSLTPSERTAALSNRAACWLVCGEFQATLNDCNEGIVGLLKGQGVTGLEDLHAWVESQVQGLDGVCGPAWAEDPKWKSLQRLIARRGAAYSHLRLYEGAADDLSTSASIARCTGDSTQADALAADAVRIRQLLVHLPEAAVTDGTSMYDMD